MRMARSDALVRGRYKLIAHEEPELVELYDLERDPGERNNLPDSDLVDYEQYKSVENSHKSPKDRSPCPAPSR